MVHLLPWLENTSPSWGRLELAKCVDYDLGDAVRAFVRLRDPQADVPRKRLVRTSRGLGGHVAGGRYFTDNGTVLQATRTASREDGGSSVQ